MLKNHLLKNAWKKRCIALLALLLSVLDPVNAGVSLDKSTLIYEGQISKEFNSNVKTLYEQALIKPTTLAIRSGGGPVLDGLDLGRWVLAQQLDIEISQFCFSSCANYVLVAGNHLLLGERAIIGWHGNARAAHWRDADIDNMVINLNGQEKQQEWQHLRFHYDAVIEQAIDEEKRFYQQIGVSPDIMTVGHKPELIELARKKGFRGWTFALPALKKFGIKNIELIDGQWTPTSPKSFPLMVIGDID